MDVEESTDPRAFLEGVRPTIRKKLEEEIKDLGGVKFQLALKIQLRKTNPDGVEEYTDRVFRHMQVALLQVSKINKALNEAFPCILEALEKWTQRGLGWMVDSAGSFVGHCSIPATERRLLLATSSSFEEQESTHECEEQG